MRGVASVPVRPFSLGGGVQGGSSGGGGIQTYSLGLRSVPSSGSVPSLPVDSSSDGAGEYGIVEFEEALLFCIVGYGIVVTWELSLIAESSEPVGGSFVVT